MHKIVKRILITILIIAIIGIVILNLFPSVELWLHRITGWY